MSKVACNVEVQSEAGTQHTAKAEAGWESASSANAHALAPIALAHLPLRGHSIALEKG